MLRVVTSVPSIRTTKFPGGETVPVLGQGTWRMGDDKSKRKREVAALRTGIELGMTLIATAEMYANGGAEQVVGGADLGRWARLRRCSRWLPACSRGRRW